MSMKNIDKVICDQIIGRNIDIGVTVSVLRPQAHKTHFVIFIAMCCQ